MKYTKTYKDGSGSEELTYDQAKELISRYYEERTCTYDEMLARTGTINMTFSYLEVTEG